MRSISRLVPARRSVALSIVAGLAAGLLWVGPVGAGEVRQAVTLTIEAPEQVVQGDQYEVTIRLTDERGRPLVGETVAVVEELRFFDYVDFRPIALLRIDHAGTATLSFTPRTPGRSSLTVDFAGTGQFESASAAASFTVAEGTGVVTHLTPVRADSILPRGVTAVWFLILLIGVWLALATAVYQLVRIPREGEVSGGRS
jgi:hypothetical protein